MNKNSANAIDFLKWLRENKYFYRGTSWMKDKNIIDKFTDEQVCELFIKQHLKK